MTRVMDVMTRGARSLSPGDSMQRAAQAMDELNVGVLPICENDKVVGMLTDRDITVRGVAQGLSAEGTRVEQVMSGNVRCCFEEQDLNEALEQMQDDQIRRMAVLDRDQKLVGMLSLGDVAAKTGATDSDMAETLASISEPSEPDRSTVGTASAVGATGAAQQR